MSNNDYYDNSGRGGNNFHRSDNESIYEGAPYQSSTVPIAYSQPPPPPSSHSPPPPSYTSRVQNQQTGASPFVTDFDDHVHPMDRSPSQSTMSHNLPNQSTTTFTQDTSYHGHAGYANDDIPLQSRTYKADGDGVDHVYDAEPGYGQQLPMKKHQPRFGELGMWGSGKKRIPFIVYIFTIIQLAVFITELVRNSQETGTPIQIQPRFNPMIGPSNYVLINMGARFVACMHEEPTIPKDVTWPCPNTTSTDSDDPNNQCSLGELCGFGAPFTNENPDQWFRFIIPIFMHAGVVHIIFNLLLQLTIGREMERVIGSIRFFIVYMSAGIFGFVMGGNYGGTGYASVGASGSLFGIIALTLLDLLYSWKERKRPGRELLVIVIEILISFVLGLLPGLDNFAHIGGFLIGIAVGISVLHSPNALRLRIGDDTPYTTVMGSNNEPPNFLKNPVGFFKGRKPLWWGWWLIRASTLIVVIIGFILLLQNFYVNRNTCDWCRYLSCVPINDWCDNENLMFNNS